MAQLTAVDWFFRWMNDNPEATHKECVDAYEQAKQIEKQQTENAYNAGSKEIEQDKDNAAWYYFETYVKQQQ